MQLNKQKSLPPELRSIISEETIEFLVYSKRKYTSISALKILAFGLFWFAFSCFLFYLVVSHYFSEMPNELIFSNVILLIFSEWTYSLLSLFIIVGIFLLVIAVRRFIIKGGYFVGTPTRLIHYNGKKIAYHYWHIFQEKIRVYPKTGEIIFKLQTGKIHRRSNSSGTYFVADKIEITSVENVTRIAQIAQKHIEEHSQDMFLETKKLS